MFQGQYIFGNTAVYSPWMPRGGDNLRMTADVIQITGVTLDVEVATKKSEDSGDGTVLTSGKISTSTTGLSQKTFTGEVNDLVRYKFTTSGGAATDYVLFRMLNPIWYDEV